MAFYRNSILFPILISILFGRYWARCQPQYSNSRKTVKAFISNKAYGTVDNTTRITVTWYPSYPDSRVNVSCVARIKDCLAYCDYYYSTCIDCYTWSDAFTWQNSTVAEEGAMSATITDLPLDQIRSNNMIIVCSTSLMVYNSYWSTPVVVREKLDYHSPPRLAVAGINKTDNASYIYLYDASFVDSVGELMLISKQPNGSKSIDFHSGSSENENNPNIVKPTDNNKTADFCINWVSGLRYEIQNKWVEGELNSSKIVEINPYDREETTIYQATGNVTLHQLVCQPIKDDEKDDILAWSQTNITSTTRWVRGKKKTTYRNETSIMISHPIGNSSSIDVLGTCAEFSSCKKRFPISTALAMDLTANKLRLVYYDQTGDIYAIDWEPCNCSRLADISLNTKTKNVTRIAVDMSYIYMVINGELKLVPREYPDTVYDVDLTRNGVKNITDILAVSPDLQEPISESDYFPEIDYWNITMVTPSVAEVNISLNWLNNQSSQRPPYKVEVRYGKVDEASGEGFSNLGYKKLETGYDFQKSTNVTLLIPNLEYEETYWIQVVIELKDAKQYSAEYSGLEESRSFYSQFSDATQGYGYNAESAKYYGSGEYASSSSSSSSSSSNSESDSGSSGSKGYSVSTSKLSSYQSNASASSASRWIVVFLVIIGAVFYY